VHKCRRPLLVSPWALARSVVVALRRLSTDLAVSRRSGSLFLQGGACVKASECLPHTFADGVAHECSHCADSDALECTADTSLKCETKFLSAGACVNAERCPAGTFANVDSAFLPSYSLLLGCLRRLPADLDLALSQRTNALPARPSSAMQGPAPPMRSRRAPPTSFPAAPAFPSPSARPAPSPRVREAGLLFDALAMADIASSADSHACLACAVLDSNAATCTKAGGATSCLNELSVYHGSCGRCPDWTYPDGNPSTCRDCWTEWKGASKCTSVTLLAWCIRALLFLSPCVFSLFPSLILMTLQLEARRLQALRAEVHHDRLPRRHDVLRRRGQRLPAVFGRIPRLCHLQQHACHHVRQPGRLPPLGAQRRVRQVVPDAAKLGGEQHRQPPQHVPRQRRLS